MTVAHIVYILAAILWGIWTYKTVKFYKKWFKEKNPMEVPFLPGMWVCFNIIIPLGILCLYLVYELLEIINNNWSNTIF